MASMFPPNLDDGERWLPAEIIPDVIGTHHHLHRHRSRHVGVDRLTMAELARQIAALGFFKPTRSAVRNPQPDHQGFRPVSNGYGSAYVNGLRVPSAGSLGGTGAFLPLSRAQVREEGRARALPRNGLVRAMPGRVNGPSKDSGGTGVFLPRVVNNDVQKKTKESNGYDGEQQQRQKQKKHLQQAIRYAAAAAAAAGAEVKQQQQQLVMAPPIPAAAEVTLPQEWTY